jgi:hypothetical protein
MLQALPEYSILSGKNLAHRHTSLFCLAVCDEEKSFTKMSSGVGGATRWIPEAGQGFD